MCLKNMILAILKNLAISLILGLVSYELLNLWSAAPGLFDIPDNPDDFKRLSVLVALAFAATLLSVDIPPAKRRPAGRGNRGASRDTGRDSGTVKWFKDELGYGFITTDDGREIFIHFRNIRKRDGQRTLTEGQRVSFFIVMDRKGPRADEVMEI